MKESVLIILFIDTLFSTILSLAFLFNSEFIFSVLWGIMVCVSWYLFKIIVEDIEREWKI